MAHDVMQLLHDGIPLTLLLDLATDAPPPSRSILRDERASTSWIPQARNPRTDGRTPDTTR